jgi:iron complex transport system ATP-binding protein
MLALRDARIARGPCALLEAVTFEARRGEVLALMGANGVGKTTLLASIAGILPLAGGALELDGVPLASLDARTRATRIAFIESTSNALEALSVREAVENARYPHHRWWEWTAKESDGEAVDRALAQVGITHLAQRELATLSAGERQRVWIAVGLAQDADVLLLDEPTSHLDVRYALEVLELARELARSGKIVIAVLHLLEEAADYADRIALLGAGGLIATGKPAEVFTNSAIKRAYSVEVEVSRHKGGLAFRRNAALSREDTA